MKKSTLVANLFIVLVLILTAFGVSGQSPVQAQGEDDVDLLATDG